METSFTIDDARFVRGELSRDLKELVKRHVQQFSEVLSKLGLDGEVAGEAFSNQLLSVVPFRRARLLEVRFDWMRCDVVATYRSEDETCFGFSPTELAVALDAGKLRPAR
jgi:hypothetical protein